METKIIRKTKISWVINEESLIAFDKLQATCYNSYMYADKQPFLNMKQTVLDSRPEELNSWVDVISLAQKYKILGYGTRIKQEWR